MSEQNVPDSEDWDDLVAALQRGSCIIMLGAHAVTARFDKDSAPEPLPDAATKYLRRRLEREGLNPPERADFSTLAQEALKHVGREGVEEWVRHFFERQGGYVDPSIAKIAELPLGVVVNTVPGLPIDDVFARHHPDLAVAVFDRNGPATNLLDGWTPDRPLLYHLHGSLSRPSSLAITDSDLLDVLVSVVSSDPPLPANLLSTLRDRERTYLFLGFRLYQWQQRVLMRVLDEATARPRRTSRSFAFEADEIYDGTRNFFTRGHGINFFTDMTPDQLVTELHRRATGDAAPDAAPAQTTFPQKIFICHASEDEQTAAQLAARLRSDGLRPWIDQDDLRGGDRWDGLIETTLESDVRYVVILRSRNFARKRGIESYVNQEVDVALRRSRRFGRSADALRFVIPVHIDDDRTPDAELDEFQAIDCTAEHGAGRLVSVIKRDIQEEMMRA